MFFFEIILQKKKRKQATKLNNKFRHVLINLKEIFDYYHLIIILTPLSGKPTFPLPLFLLEGWSIPIWQYVHKQPLSRVFWISSWYLISRCSTEWLRFIKDFMISWNVFFDFLFLDQIYCFHFHWCCSIRN